MSKENQNYKCSSCGADWTEHDFNDDCRECGGGAMERGCILCGGRCGSVYKRAVFDSWDAKEAHWIGGCKLSSAEQQKYMKKWMKKSQ